MHLDPVAARRLMTGRQVVHGLHLLLWSLEHWQSHGDTQPASISCSFENPVSVGEVVDLTERLDARGRVVLTASVDGVTCVRCALTASSAAPSRRPSAVTPAGATAIPVDDLTHPMDEAPESHLGKAYAVTPTDRGLCRAFPQACRILGAQRLPAVAALSYFAGMVAPGLHSVLSSIKFDLVQEPTHPERLIVSLRKYHSNVRLFDFAFDGAVQGEMQAFFRPAPQRQPSMAELAALVEASEFSGTQSLIVGGSRGLGELTAKLLAAGGGDIVLTYRSGQDDAYRVRDEINAAGRACEALRFDVMTDGWEALAFERRQFDAVYFFPTPQIFRKGAAVFNHKRFAEFAEIYLARFFSLCEALERRAGKPVRVLFPSSVAVTERPKGLTEYAMVKAAGEVMVEDINRSFKHVTVVSNRLPRLSTDQTASILEVPAESNAGTLLPIIRSMFR